MTHEGTKAGCAASQLYKEIQNKCRHAAKKITRRESEGTAKGKRQKIKKKKQRKRKISHVESLQLLVP